MVGYMFCWWVKPEHRGTYRLRTAHCPEPRFKPRIFLLGGNSAVDIIIYLQYCTKRYCDWTIFRLNVPT